jgi:ferric-dicitrate binding protein FerR (iron transport regulator)
MDQQYINTLIDKHLQNKPLSDSEKAILQEWLTGYAEGKGVFESEEMETAFQSYLTVRMDNQFLESAISKFKQRSGYNDQTVAAGHLDNNETASPVHPVSYLRKWWWAAAAILLIGSTVAIVVTSTRQSNKPATAVTKSIAPSAILPGSNKAVLTIGNRSLNLSNNKTGIAVGASITYNDGERIADAEEMLQLATPRGGQYQAILPDGTKVWLNAASSIKFPSRFDRDQRTVEVAGEVYLEVAQNAGQPFKVSVNGTEIIVLGTNFNVNAYDDESELKTTLVNGSIQVRQLHQSVILKPGQRAEISKGNDRKIKVATADTDQTLAWKNGLFDFTGISLQEAMRQLSRWYDITVRYEGETPSIRFDGTMDKGLSLPDVLVFIEKLGVRYRMEGRTLIIQ